MYEILIITNISRINIKSLHVISYYEHFKKKKGGKFLNITWILIYHSYQMKVIAGKSILMYYEIIVVYTQLDRNSYWFPGRKIISL